LFMTFWGFFGGGKTKAALPLPAQVLEDLALWPFKESSADSELVVRAEIRTAGIGESPSKMGMREMKLSKDCNCIERE
jgi:hypothetical protein